MVLSCITLLISNITVASVESQKPVSIFDKPKNSDKPDITVVTCVNINKKSSPWLGEFIKHQKVSSVDHVHVSVFDEYITSGSMFEQVDQTEDIKQSILKGHVTISLWNNWYDYNSVIPNQFSDLIRKLDGILCYHYSYDYVFPLDLDDYFIPNGTNKKLKHYISKWCPYHDKKTSSCSFKLKIYFPGYCDTRTPESVPLSRIVLYNHAVIGQINIDSSCVDCLNEGYGVVDVPPTEAYIAKLDKFGKPKSFHCD